MMFSRVKNITTAFSSALILLVLTSQLSITGSAFANGPNLTYKYSSEAKFTSPLARVDSDFQTSLLTGAATYTYDFFVSPGVGGFQPSVQLLYNSQNLKGQPGVIANGWRLNDSYIQRDIKHTPQSTSDDTFILHLLGASHKLVDIGGSRYKTEIDSYMHITRSGDTWNVTDPNGTKYVFGNRTNERLYVKRSDGSNWYVGQSWLRTIIDRNNNVITYNYTKVENAYNQGVMYPSNITYGAGAKMRVDLWYSNDSRPDQFASMNQGVIHRRGRVLAEVRASADGRLARRYVFHRERNTIHTNYHLKTITEIGHDGTQLPPTRFSYRNIEVQRYQGEDRVIVHKGNSNWTGGVQGRSIRTTDKDSDVINDLIDINCDGLPDQLKGDRGDWTVRLNQWKPGTGSFGGKISLSLPAPRGDIDIRDVSSDESRPHTKSGMFDWDGDGCIDIVEMHGGNTFYHWHNRQADIGNRGWGFSTRISHNSWLDSHVSRVQDTDKGRKAPNVTRAFIDMTGDGLQDLVAMVPNTTNKWHVYRRSPNLNCKNDCFPTSAVHELTTGHPGNWIGDFTSDDSEVEMGLYDMNADGLPDVFRADDKTRRWWMNTGYSLLPQPCTRCTFPYKYITDVQSDGDIDHDFVDINADGFPDYVRPSGSDNTMIVRYGNGRGFGEERKWRKPLLLPDNDQKFRDLDTENSRDEGRIQKDFVDMNGDGALDFVTSQGGTWKWNESVASYNDLLSSVQSPLGGITRIEYGPSNAYTNKHLPYNVMVVTKVTQNNGRADDHKSIISNSYQYSGGFHDFSEKEFRGFETVREISSTTGLHTIYTFNHDDARKGSLRRREVQNRFGIVFESEVWTHSFTRPYSGVLRTVLDRHEIIRGAANHTRTRYERYNQYGQPTRIFHDGDIATADDDYREYSHYASNDGKWLSALRDVTLRDPSDRWLRRSVFYHDGDTTYAGIPSKGNVTRTARFFNFSEGLSNAVLENFTYDSYGNQVTAQDGNGNTSSTTFDATHRAYPITTINALGHRFQRRFDARHGGMLRETDPNGHSTSYEYDGFGRQTKAIRPGDSSADPTVTTRFINANSTSPLRIETRYKQGDGGHYRTVISIDGAGNPIQQITEGDESSHNVVDMFYDNVGRIASTTHPYRVTTGSTYIVPRRQSSKQTTYAYDELNRQISIAYADSTSESFQYTGRRVTHTDRSSKMAEYTVRADGNVTKIRQGNGLTHTTDVILDRLGDISTIRDSAGNSVNITRDLLGRILQIDHPDMGTWKYGYDKNDNLVSQTDARGITTTLRYDKLNRLTKQDFPDSPDMSLFYDDVSATYREKKLGVLSTTFDEVGGGNYEYDNRLRLTGHARLYPQDLFPLPNTEVRFGYDPMDRITSRTSPTGSNRSLAYTNQNTLESISGVIRDLRYAPHGALSGISYDNGTEVNHTFDANTLRVTNIDAGNLADIDIGYDNKGNVTSVSDSATGFAESYAYDDLDRLVSANSDVARVYAYNRSNSITSYSEDGAVLTFRYGESGSGPHQLSSISASEVATFEIPGLVGGDDGSGGETTGGGTTGDTGGSTDGSTTGGETGSTTGDGTTGGTTTGGTTGGNSGDPNIGLECNIAHNPSFEELTDDSMVKHWSAASWGGIGASFELTNEGNEVRDGFLAAKTSVSGYVGGTEAKWISDHIFVDPDTTYRFSLAVRGTADVHLQPVLYNLSGNVVGYVGFRNIGANDTWNRYNTNFQTTGDTATVRLELRTRSNGQNYFDAVWLVETAYGDTCTVDSGGNDNNDPPEDNNNTGSNLMTNNNFENSTEGWNEDKWRMDGELAWVDNPISPDTSRHVLVQVNNANGGDGKWRSDRIPVQGNTQYFIGSRYRSNVPTHLMLTIIKSDGSKKYPYLARLPASESWTINDVPYTTPDGAEAIEFRHFIKDAGYLRMDDVWLSTRARSDSTDTGDTGDTGDNNDGTVNLMVNPTFENSTDGWNKDAWNATARHIHDNDHLLVEVMSTTNGGDAKWRSDRVNVEPNTTYYIGSKYRSDVGTHIMLSVYKSDGTTEYPYLGRVPPSEQWRIDDFVYTTPANTTSVVYRHFIKDPGYLRTDDIWLSTEARP